MKSNPWHRIAATASAVLIVTLVAGAYRMAESHGVFTAVRPGFAGSCRAIPSAIGPEDIAIDDKSKIAFVSATDRPARSKGTPSPKDGLYSYAYTQPGAGLVKLAEGADDLGEGA